MKETRPLCPYCMAEVYLDDPYYDFCYTIVTETENIIWYHNECIEIFENFVILR